MGGWALQLSSAGTRHNHIYLTCTRAEGARRLRCHVRPRHTGVMEEKVTQLKGVCELDQPQAPPLNEAWYHMGACRIILLTSTWTSEWR